MSEELQCFISASYDVDTSYIKNALAEYNVNAVDIYDFSIGDSIQQILKRKIRQSDFAIFIVSDNTSSNVIFEMGVCEGIGKQYFVFLEKELKIPSYVESQLFIRTDWRDRKFLKAAVEKILQSVAKKEKASKHSSVKQKPEKKQYSVKVRENLHSYIQQIKLLREVGSGIELEHVVGEVFKNLNFPYAENKTNKDRGVDFALWNDELGKIIGNPIVVEVKYGSINHGKFHQAEEEIKMFVEKTDAKIALLLYLDKDGKRYKIKSSLTPLIISYDIEDFVSDLLIDSFESLILAQRNKIAHGIN
jgi:hypothetical protein